MMSFRTAALRESQQVALDSELLDTMPKQYVNREEQTTLHLECRGSSGKKCQVLRGLRLSKLNFLDDVQ